MYEHLPTCMYICIYVCVPYACLVPTEPSPGPLQEQQKLLIAEPSLHALN